jgi:hypothetical protein
VQCHGDARGLIAATESNPPGFKAIKSRLAGHQSLDQAVAEQRVEFAIPNLAVEADHTPYGMVLRLPGLTTKSSAISISAGQATSLHEWRTTPTE